MSGTIDRVRSASPIVAGGAAVLASPFVLRDGMRSAARVAGYEARAQSLLAKGSPFMDPRTPAQDVLHRTYYAGVTASADAAYFRRIGRSSKAAAVVLAVGGAALIAHRLGAFRRD